MATKSKQVCTSCGRTLRFERRQYPFAEGGVPNVVLQGVELADCGHCGNSEIIIPQLARIHRVIALALANSPRRLTGPQFRFLRKHLGKSGEQMAEYLHTDKTKISKWERAEDSIGQASDRLMRLLVTALDPELAGNVRSTAEHLRKISDEPGEDIEIHVDVEVLTAAYVTVRRAAA